MKSTEQCGSHFRFCIPRHLVVASYSSYTVHDAYCCLSTLVGKD